MFQEYKKIMIISSITFGMFLLLLLFLFVDISLGPIQIASISTILSQYDKVTQAEEDLIATQNTHRSTLSVLDKSKKDYQREKSEYEALSDETIRVIKEATTQEEYSIEYMWIRLGNSAKVKKQMHQTKLIKQQILQLQQLIAIIQQMIQILVQLIRQQIQILLILLVLILIKQQQMIVIQHLYLKVIIKKLDLFLKFKFQEVI